MRRQGRAWVVHRWVWTQVYGPIPEGMVIMHTCDNRKCYRLDHLRMGTQAENMADMWDKGRANRRRPTIDITPYLQ